MAELNFKKLADAPILAEVPDGAKVYAEVDGKVYRVAGDNLGGGGIPTAIMITDGVTVTCENMTYTEMLELVEAKKPCLVAIWHDSELYYQQKILATNIAGTVRIDIPYEKNTYGIWWTEQGLTQGLYIG